MSLFRILNLLSEKHPDEHSLFVFVRRHSRVYADEQNGQRVPSECLEAERRV